MFASQAFGGEPALPARYLPVPLISQATDYSCGAAALLSILYYWRVYSKDEDELRRILHTTPNNGTHPAMIVRVARLLGLGAFMKENLTLVDLGHAIGRGDTVILDIQAWPDAEEAKKPWRDMWDSGHYVVLVGLDRERAYLMDPSVSDGYAYIPLEELSDRWHDYEMEAGVRREYRNLGIFIHNTVNPRTLPLTQIK